MPFLGELAAIGTSLAFSVGSTFFTIAGHALGTGVVNRVRLALALIFTMILHWLLLGTFYPLNAAPDVIFWMALSGLIGFVIGDAFLFQAFVTIGPRLSMLMMALAPVLGTIMAWVFLHETLSVIELLGIAVTMFGIAIVVGEPQAKAKSETPHEDRRKYIIGLLFGFGAALGQAGGSLLSKIGLSGGLYAMLNNAIAFPSLLSVQLQASGKLPAISGNAFRLTASVIAIWLWAIARREFFSTFKALNKNRRATGFVVIATFAGPVIGVWLALTSVQLAPLGVVTTLQSLPPIFLIPISYFVFKERITRQAVIGTIVALVGSILLFF